MPGSQYPTDYEPTGRNGPDAKAERLLYKLFGWKPGMPNPFTGPEGFAVVRDVIFWASKVAAVKRDTCYAARGRLSANTEVLVLHALAPLLRALGMELMLKPSPNSIVDMLLRHKNRLIPVLMQQRVDPDAAFKHQPEATRLNALVLLLVHGVGLFVTTGTQLAGMSGPLLTKNLPSSSLCRTAEVAAGRMEMLVTSDQVGFLEATADQSGNLVCCEEVVPEGHLQAAKGVALAQLLLGPLMACLSAPSRPINLEGLPFGIVWRQPGQQVLPYSPLRLAMRQRSKARGLQFNDSKAAQQLLALSDMLQRFGAAAGNPPPGSGNNSTSSSSGSSTAPPPALQAAMSGITAREHKKMQTLLQWLAAEVSAAPQGSIGLMQYTARTREKLQQLRRVLDACIAAQARSVAVSSGDGAGSSHSSRRRVEWTADLDTRLLEAGSDCRLSGLSGQQLWDAISEQLFGDSTRAAACNKRVRILTGALHWLSSQNVAASSTDAPLPGLQHKDNRTTAEALTDTADKLLADASLLQRVRQVHNPHVRTGTAGALLSPSTGLLNWAKVSTADSIVVGASGQAGGNAITAGVADVLSRTPVLAHVNLVNQELALVNALDMKHAGLVRGNRGVRGDSFRSNCICPASTLQTMSSFRHSAESLYPGLQQQVEEAAAHPVGSSTSSGSASSSASASASTANSSSSSPPQELPPVVVHSLRAIANKLESDSPMLRAEGRQELERLCGGRDRLQQHLDELVCVVLPAQVQLLLSKVLCAFDAIYLAGTTLMLAAAGVDLFAAGVSAGQREADGTLSTEAWLQTQYARLAALPAGAEAERGAAQASLLQQVAAGVEDGGIMSLDKAWGRLIRLRVTTASRHGLLLPSASSPIRPLSRMSGVKQNSRLTWDAAFPRSPSKTTPLQIGCGLSDEAPALKARNLVIAAAWPTERLSDEGYPFSEQDLLSVACWLQLAAANGVPGAPWVLQQLQQRNKPLAERVHALPESDVASFAEAVKKEYHLRAPMPRNKHQLLAHFAAEPDTAPAAAAAGGEGASAAPGAAAAAAAADNRGGMRRSGRKSSRSLSSSSISSSSSSSSSQLAAALGLRMSVSAPAAAHALQGLQAADAVRMKDLLGSFGLAKLDKLHPVAQLLPDTVVLFKGKGPSSPRHEAMWLALSSEHADSFMAANSKRFDCTQQPQLLREVTVQKLAVNRQYGQKSQQKSLNKLRPKAIQAKQRQQQQQQLQEEQQQEAEQQHQQQQEADGGAAEEPQEAAAAQAAVVGIKRSGSGSSSPAKRSRHSSDGQQQQAEGVDAEGVRAMEID